MTAFITSPFFTLALGMASFTEPTMKSPIEAYFRRVPPSTLMQSTFRAPLLSATSRTLSAWIMTGPRPCACASLRSHRHFRPDQRLPGPLLATEDRLHRPPLVVRERPGLHDAHPVANPALVLLVVRLVAHALLQVLAVLAVADEPRHLDHHGLVHLVRHDDSVALLPPPARPLGARVAHGVPPRSTRARSIVLTRARSRRVSRTFMGFGSCDVARRRRRWKSASTSSCSRACSSASLRSRSSDGFSAMAHSPATPLSGSPSRRRASRSARVVSLHRLGRNRELRRR